jgi:hypothetical protein
MALHVASKKSSRSMETGKSRVHTFQGQDLAEPVLEHLRRNDRATDDRVETLVQLELARSRELMPGVTGEDRAPRIVRLVNDTMRLWNFGLIHTATQEGHDWSVKWGSKTSKKGTASEMLAFHDALLLKRQGLLHRIRRCGRPGCPEWFFAKFDHQNFHSDKCRVAVLSADEQRKENRKQYMRDLRAKKKLKKFRSSKKVKKGGK